MARAAKHRPRPHGLRLTVTLFGPIQSVDRQRGRCDSVNKLSGGRMRWHAQRNIARGLTAFGLRFRHGGRQRSADTCVDCRDWRRECGRGRTSYLPGTQSETKTAEPKQTLQLSRIDEGEVSGQLPDVLSCCRRFHELSIRNLADADSGQSGTSVRQTRCPEFPRHQCWSSTTHRVVPPSSRGPHLQQTVGQPVDREP
jgi:hypothetical protein